MAKALETYFSELSDLQKAAMARIADYKKELAEYGIYVRSSMELEFMTYDKQGNPMNYGLSLYNLFESIKNAVGTDREFLERFTHEAHGTMGFFGRMTPIVPAQYEVTITEPMEFKPTAQSTEFQPEKVAGITDLLRKRTIQEALESTTNLSSVNGITRAPVYATYAARPFRRYDFSRSDSYEHYDEVTSALHVNISLYDKDKHNLFALSPDLMQHCTRALIELQNDAALPMLPTPDSLWRIGSNNSAPLGIGISSGNNLDDHAKDSAGKKNISVRMVRELRYSKAAPSALDKTRIENRLPGADADPLVCMAITMAAMVDAVRKHVKKDKPTTVNGKHVPLPFTVDLAENPEKLAYNLPKLGTIPPEPNDDRISRSAHSELIEKYKQAKRIRTLLGEELYNGILNEYAKTATLEELVR